jgi:hypothetical protein
MSADANDMVFMVTGVAPGGAAPLLARVPYADAVGGMATGKSASAMGRAYQAKERQQTTFSLYGTAYKTNSFLFAKDIARDAAGQLCLQATGTYVIFDGPPHTVAEGGGGQVEAVPVAGTMCAVVAALSEEGVVFRVTAAADGAGIRVPVISAEQGKRNGAWRTIMAGESTACCCCCCCCVC